MGLKAGVLAAVVAALAASFPSGVDAQGTSAPLLGQNHRLSSNTPGRQVDVPGLAVDPANPNHIVEANVDPNNFQCDYHVSFDGGNTWTGGHLTVAPVPGLDPPFPSPACAQNFDAGGYAHFNTGIVFGSAQNVYITFSVHRGDFNRLDTTPPTEGGKGDDVVVARSIDGGRTFQPAVLAIPGSENPQPVATRPQIAVQRGAGVGGQDRLYVNAWELHVQSGGLGPRRMLVSRSDDGGATWPLKRVVASKEGVRSPVEAALVGTDDEIVRELSQPVVGPDGHVYAAYKNVDRLTGTTCAPPATATNCIVVAKSTNQGQSWTQKSTGVTVSSGGQPRLAIDPTTPPGIGTLYVVFHSSGDVMLQSSIDGGQTWSTAIRVEDEPPDTAQAFPQVSVGPGGRVNVVWFDGRHAYPGGGARLGDIYSDTSTYGGATFGKDRRVTDRTFNRDVGIDSALGTYSFYGPVAQPLPDGSLFAAWTDSREGNFDTGYQDIYLSRSNPAAPAASSTLATATTPGLSVMLSRLAYPGGSEATGGGASPISKVVVANEGDLAAALAGSVLARSGWGPLLLSPAGGMPAFVKADAVRMKPVGGFVIGETSRLSPTVETELQKSTRDGTGVSRVAPGPGVPAADRDAEIGRQVGELIPGSKPEAVIANPNTPDAAAGSALAAARKLPILFVDSRPTLPPPTADAISSLGITKVLIVGGTGSVNTDVEASLKSSLGDANVKRLGGADQYATSEETLKEAKTRGLPANVVYVADGARPMDATLLGAATGRLNGLMLLSPSAAIAPAQAKLGPLGVAPETDRLMGAIGTGGTDPTLPGSRPDPTSANPPLPDSPRLAGCRSGRRANLISLTTGNDRRTGTRLADMILAGAGNDVIDAGAGDDCVDLGPGRDRGQGAAGDDYLVGGSGNDRVGGSRGRDRLSGGSGNDRLAGNSGRDSMVGDSGRDRLSAGSGNDRVSGGSGSDRVAGGGGRDRISAGSGNDSISAADGRSDRISCGSGRDRVVADAIDRVARSCERVRRRR